ncbi:MAG: hypothetical protein OFPI_20730 [Osedax symbiont Rs2]|nr:MAG: hypothetical protein OFPI_20730 [Osedax symbiont Rs2]
MINKLLPLLKYFHALAETGSFTKAAERLCISQSTVSIQIRKLESILGVILLHRKSKHQFALTREGAALASETCNSFERLAAQLNAIQSDCPTSGDINLSSSASIGIKLLLPIIAQLKKIHPKLTIHLQETSAKKLFFEDKIDIATNYGVPDVGLHSIYLKTITKKMVASASYIKRCGLPTNLQQLAQHQLIMQAGGKNEFQALFAKSDLDITVLNNQSVSSNLAKLEAIKLGLGIGIVPDYLLDSDDDTLVLISTMDLRACAEELYLVCEKRRRYESKIQWLMTELATALKTESKAVRSPLSDH